MSGEKRSALVETLTAEVRVLMVGSRQVTLSVFRQLDWIATDQIEPFGRVNDERDVPTTHPFIVIVVGADKRDGSLARSFMGWPSAYARTRRVEALERLRPRGWEREVQIEKHEIETALYGAKQAEPWLGLPLIVLAGLR